MLLLACLCWQARRASDAEHDVLMLMLVQRDVAGVPAPGGTSQAPLTPWPTGPGRPLTQPSAQLQPPCQPPTWPCTPQPSSSQVRTGGRQTAVLRGLLMTVLLLMYTVVEGVGGSQRRSCAGKMAGLPKLYLNLFPSKVLLRMFLHVCSRLQYRRISG